MKLEEWLYAISDAETPDNSIIAYHFGLFENLEGSATLYLVGSAVFHEGDDDWIANVDFEPQDNYHTIVEIGFEGLPWDEILEKVRIKLTEFTGTDKFRHSFFSNAQAITLGFDEGDLIRII